MKQHLITAIKFIVFLSFGILLLWLGVRDVTPEVKEEIFRSLREANYIWVAISIGFGIIAHLSRAIRWRMLLQPLGFSPKLSNTFYAVMIGYLLNLFIPRLGEVTRCGILRYYEKIPLPQSFGTVIAERIIDLLVMFLFFILSIWISYEKLQNYISEKIIAPLKLKLLGIMENTMTLIALIAVAVLIISLSYIFRKKIVQNPIVRKVRTILLSFLEGIRSVMKLKSPLMFTFHSFFIWVMYLMTTFACIFAFPETRSLSLGDCLVIMCFGGLGVIATPGGIGAYQWIVLQIMLLWGYSQAIGLAFGWTLWVAQTAAIVVVGLASFGMLALGKKKEEAV